MGLDFQGFACICRFPPFPSKPHCFHHLTLALVHHSAKEKPFLGTSSPPSHPCRLTDWVTNSTLWIGDTPKLLNFLANTFHPLNRRYPWKSSPFWKNLSESLFFHWNNIILQEPPCYCFAFPTRNPFLLPSNLPLELPIDVIIANLCPFQQKSKAILSNLIEGEKTMTPFHHLNTHLAFDLSHRDLLVKPNHFAEDSNFYNSLEMRIRAFKKKKKKPRKRNGIISFPKDI